jgi:hypothetical protein
MENMKYRESSLRHARVRARLFFFPTCSYTLQVKMKLASGNKGKKNPSQNTALTKQSTRDSCVMDKGVECLSSVLLWMFSSGDPLN